MAGIEQVTTRSQRGASLPLALLLFLICSSLAAVVLAAATTAAGQASQRADSDQAYYSVLSAAKLFSDELDGQTVTIEERVFHRYVTTTTYSDGATETSVEIDPNPDDPDVPGPSLSIGTSSDYTLLELATVAKLYGGEVTDVTTALDSCAGNIGDPPYDDGSDSEEVEFVLSHTVDNPIEGFDAEAIEVTVKQTIEPDWSVKLELMGGDDAGSNTTSYKVELGLTADVQSHTSVNQYENPSIVNPDISVVPNGTGYTRTENVIKEELRTTVITWHSAGLELAGGGA